MKAVYYKYRTVKQREWLPLQAYNAHESRFPQFQENLS